MRILAVDDDPLILEMLQSAMAKYQDYELTCSDSVEAAQELLDEEIDPFDCFLLDYNLPGMTGIEFCEILRKTSVYRTVPIILITANRDSDLMSRAFYAGATDFLPKPLDGVELGARINSASMLNQSLRREREAKETLDEVSRHARQRFGDALRLEAEGVLDPLEMENALLRLPAGCYGMNIFCVEVEGLKEVHQAVDAMAFREHLEISAEAIVASLRESNAMVAYGGHGRFIGLTLDRMRLRTAKVHEQMQNFLTLHWDANRSGMPKPPELSIAPVTDQRILSGLSASDKIRAFLSGDVVDAAGGEDNLFGDGVRAA